MAYPSTVASTAPLVKPRATASAGAGAGGKGKPPMGFGLGQNTAAMLKFLLGLYGPEVHQPALAPLTPQQLEQQANAYVRGAINPQLAQLERESAAQTAGGVGSIRGGTANYADALRPLADQATRIGHEQAAADTAETSALASYLKGSGQQTFDDVQAKLDAAGVHAPVAPNLGAGSAGIAAATGLASAHDATDEAAHNATLAALLPGFAQLQGQAAEGSFRAGQIAGLRDSEGQIRAQTPALENTVLGNLQSNETSKATARTGALNDRASSIGSFLGNSVDDQTQLDIARLSGLFGVQKAGAAAALPDAALSAKRGIIVDHAGKPILGPDGQPVYVAGWHPDPKTGKPVKDVSPTTKATTARIAARAHQAALVKADGTVRTILANALKVASKRSSATTGPFQTGPAVSKPRVGSPSYNQAVNAAVQSLETILGPYMTHAEIVQFVQARALHAGWAPAPEAPPSGNEIIPTPANGGVPTIFG